MKLFKTRHGIYMPLFLLLTAVAVLLRTVALFLGYDRLTGYYLNPALGQSADILAVVSVLLFLTYAILHRKDTGCPIDAQSPAAYIPAGIAAAALPFLSRLMFTVAKEASRSESTVRISAFLTAILAPPATVFFLLTVLLEKKQSRLRAEFGMLSALCFAAYAAYLYFNRTLPINAPSKLTEQCTFLAVSLFLLYETRISLGRECRPLYVSFALVAAHLTAYASLPSLLVYFVRGDVVADSIVGLIITFALFLFLLTRLFLTGKQDAVLGTPLTEILIADAERRAAFLAEKSPLPYNEMQDEKSTAEAQETEEIEGQLTLPSDFFADISELARVESEASEEIDASEISTEETTTFLEGDEEYAPAPAEDEGENETEETKGSDA